MRRPTKAQARDSFILDNLRTIMEYTGKGEIVRTLNLVAFLRKLPASTPTGESK